MIDVYRQVDSWREDNEAGREDGTLNTCEAGVGSGTSHAWCQPGPLTSARSELSSVEGPVLLIDLIPGSWFLQQTQERYLDINYLVPN